MIKWLQNIFSAPKTTYPLPKAWQKILDRNAAFRTQLDPATQKRLDLGIAVFVRDKYWEGCGGLELNDEHRVTIAAHALRITLGFEEDYFDDVKTILVYPATYQVHAKENVGGGIVVEGPSTRLGEAWYNGPVILAWSDIESQILKRGNPRNVIVHEFAHQLDYRNGMDADGVPPIESAEQATRWLEVMKRESEKLCKICRHRGKRSVLDCYGTTNRAEFFAVSTESFFEAADQLSQECPDLFEELKGFYRQDPRTAAF
ncbi:M90 family metallopeptidase [uncultured Rubinisphaera sp.]|uniref:M90 family metallopeptidase n=1 Tax=uncultured Rubinisphaera sp. TaxID=1678686 RepID=UPI0030D7F583